MTVEFLLYFIVGLIAGAVGAVASGGGLFSIPVLMFMGVSPINSIATTRLGSLFGGLASVRVYAKKSHVNWKLVIPYLLIISAVAGVIGPKILIQIDQSVIQTIIGIALLALCGILLFTKEYGLADLARHKKHKIAGYIMLFIAMTYAVMFGAGGGALVINVMLYFFGMKITQATATGMAIWLVGTAIASIGYIVTGLVLAEIAIPLIAGSIIGGHFGAKYVIKNDHMWLKRILGVVVGVSGVKILFF